MLWMVSCLLSDIKSRKSIVDIWPAEFFVQGGDAIVCLGPAESLRHQTPTLDLGLPPVPPGCCPDGHTRTRTHALKAVSPRWLLGLGWGNESGHMPLCKLGTVATCRKAKRENGLARNLCLRVTAWNIKSRFVEIEWVHYTSCSPVHQGGVYPPLWVHINYSSTSNSTTEEMEATWVVGRSDNTRGEFQKHMPMLTKDILAYIGREIFSMDKIGVRFFFFARVHETTPWFMR